MDNFKKKSPVLDENVRLSSTVIAEILSMFLKCNPQNSSVFLPPFRIKQLAKCTRTLSGRTRITEGDAFEGLGSFYAICMYYGGTADFGTLDVLRNSVSIIQTVLSECMMAMQLIGEVTIAHTDDKIRNFIHSIDSLKQHQLTIFALGNELAKDILRDIIRQVRICREKNNARTKAKQPVDCLMPHSIYMMASYALAHITAVLHAEGRLKDVPGLYESLVCVIHFEFKRDQYKARAAERVRKAKRIIDNDRFEQCVQMAKQLSYVVFKRVDIRYVRKLRLMRGRLARGESSPYIEFAKLKVQTLHITLLQQPKPHDENADERKGTDVKALLKWNSSDEQSVATSITKPKEDKYPVREVSAYDCVTNVGKKLPESLTSMLDEVPVDEAAPLTLSQQEAKNRHTEEASEVTENADDEATVSKEVKEMAEMNQLTINIRHYYLLSRSLREFYESGRVYFNPQDKDQRVLLLDKTKTARSKCGGFYSTAESEIRDMQQVYYDSAQRPLPRFLNQTEGMYWVCDVLIEHIYQQIHAGNMFAALNQHYLLSLQEKIKREARDVRKCRVKGVKEIAVVAQPVSTDDEYDSPSPRSALSNHTNNTLGSSQCSTFSAHSSRPISPDKSLTSRKPVIKNVTCKLNILERLQLAHDEALLERKIEALSEKSHDHEVKRRRERAKYLQEKFPHINVSNGCTTDNTQPSTSDHKMPALDKTSSADDSWSTQSPVDASSRNKPTQPQDRGTQTSVVWTAPPDPEDEMAVRKKQEKEAAEKRRKQQRERNFDEVPDNFGLEYARSILRYKEERKRQEDQQAQEIQDLLEMEAAKIKYIKKSIVQGKKDAEKREVNDSLNYKKVLEDQKKEIRKKQNHDRKLAEKKKQEEEEEEMEKIRDIQAWARLREDRERRLKEERHAMEEIRIKNMASKKEHEEILRRHKEEMRMKYLEEIQRAKEEHRMEEERKKALALMKRQRKAREEKEKVLAKIRKGNFMYHQGKLGYYDNVREGGAPFIQYEDDDGTPYYFDTVTLRTSYDMPPADATIVHYTVKEREEYDRLYGAGTYDAMLADQQYKMQCNADGGYFDENGIWHMLNGYYDENYEFV
eukprot:CAMPEP_0185039024 /NCGR_PEP_ID=MMETSP1103-20130426/35415_1 /TAXON_ID=36769 /ORGANISM="Paraphysomonas bandaiensis, Strain Caron Lab Isolate" /LENGTH=1091 /DNA_ID=CAMNT_0027577749 /DNA_START=137 /DNA_END=3408 /DNA_ORIENTATION=-